MTQAQKKYFSLFILILAATSVFAKTFQFKYSAGDNYKITSTVQEDVLVNSRFHHHAQIVNRISVEVTDVNADGSATHKANFMTSENSTGTASNTVYTWGEEYESIFERSPNGSYKISDEYFMPVVRDVPIFPQKDLTIGETWTATGHEAHDLRNSFGIEKPFKVPFTANYLYQGEIEKDGKTLDVIKANYTLYYESPKVQNSQIYEFPLKTMGFSDQTIYWDNEKGQIESYNEKFRIQIETNLGNLLVFKGTAQATVTEVEKVNNVATVEKVQEQIANLGIENTQVKTTERGIMLSIENIQFKANSSELQPSEKEKLQKIAQILQQFPNNDLLIAGHTALAGSSESCQILSEERANAVADFLIKLGAKNSDQIFTQGFGATKPIAPNTSSAGMAQNRRVEITIMEN